MHLCGGQVGGCFTCGSGTCGKLLVAHHGSLCRFALWPRAEELQPHAVLCGRRHLCSPTATNHATSTVRCTDFKPVTHTRT